MHRHKLIQPGLPESPAGVRGTSVMQWPPKSMLICVKFSGFPYPQTERSTSADLVGYSMRGAAARYWTQHVGGARNARRERVMILGSELPLPQGAGRCAVILPSPGAVREALRDTSCIAIGARVRNIDCGQGRWVPGCETLSPFRDGKRSSRPRNRAAQR